MAEKVLTIKILSPEGTVFEGNADAIFLPGAECPFEVLPDHAPIISTLSKGEIRWRNAGSEESVAVTGGVVRVKSNLVQVCAEF